MSSNQFEDMVRLQPISEAGAFGVSQALKPGPSKSRTLQAGDGATPVEDSFAANESVTAKSGPRRYCKCQECIVLSACYNVEPDER